jgi:hypothetical protein
MKILIMQSNGKHKENRLYREASCLHRSFQRIGILSECWGPGYPAYEIPFARANKDVDVILVLENYEREGWMPDLSAYSQLKIFWSIDAHIVLKRHIELCNHHAINILLSSTERYLKNFHVELKYWFPNCYPCDLFDVIPAMEKVQDIGFCGNINNRSGWLELLGIKPDVMILGNDMVRKIASYRIHWNKGIRDDINYRVFETLGAGTFLLTNKIAGLEKLLVDGRHIVTYDNGNDCIAKMRYYLLNEKEREKIAGAGHAHCKRNHTYDVRAAQLIEIIGGKI